MCIGYSDSCQSEQDSITQTSIMSQCLVMAAGGHQGKNHSILGPIGTKRVVLGSVCGFGCVLVRVWCWGI